MTLKPIEEIFEDISLPLTRFRHTVQFDLQTMCNEYLADEIVQMQCEKCSMNTTNVDFNVKTTISHSPQVLTIQLKRFSFAFGAVHGQKLMDSVFCLNELKLPINDNTAIATYTHRATVSHVGLRADDGHYITYKRASEDRCFKTNDAEVTEMTNEHFEKAALQGDSRTHEAPYILIHDLVGISPISKATLTHK